jgi:hypothetical protein
MTQAIEKNQELVNGVQYGTTTYVSAEELINKLQPCPKSLYIRGDVLPVRIGEMQEELLVEGSKPKTYQVLYPINYFILSPETVAKWQCDEDVSPNVPYTLNGNTRRQTIEGLLEKEKEKEEGIIINPVPIQEIYLNDFADDTIVYSLQIKSNDSTQAHSTVAKMRSIAMRLERLFSMGVDQTVARKQCTKIARCTPTLVSQAEKFLDKDDMSPELLEERRKLFEKLDSGLLSVDSVITIMQIGDNPAYEKSYSDIIKGLSEMYGVIISPSKSLFSKTQIVNYKKTLDAALKAKSESSDDEDEDKDNDKKQITEDDLVAARDNIKVVLKELTTEKDPLPVESVPVYKEAADKLAKVARIITKTLKPEQYQEFYSKLNGLVVEYMGDGTDLQGLEEKDIVTVGNSLMQVYQKLTKAETKPETKTETKAEGKGKGKGKGKNAADKLEGTQQEIFPTDPTHPDYDPTKDPDKMDF